MKQVKGEDGCINLTGKIEGKSILLPTSNDGFWENIEDGIKPLVKVLIDHGIKTYSSCQGHVLGGRGTLPFVSFYIDEDIDSMLVDILSRYNDTNIFYNKELNKAYPTKNNYKGYVGKIIFLYNNRFYSNKNIKKFSGYLDKELGGYICKDSIDLEDI